MSYLAEVERTRGQAAILDLLGHAAEASPGDPVAARRYAQACMRSGDRQRAPGAWQKVVGTAPDDAVAWAGLGTSLLEVGDVAGAVAAGARALELAPNDPSVHAAYGFALRTSGAQDRADWVFERGFELDPLNPYLARGVGQALIRRGDGQGLERHCRAMFELISPTGWLLAQYATALAMLGRRTALASMIDYAHLLRRIDLDVPNGFGSVASFHAALRKEQEALGAVPSGRDATDVVFGALRLPGGLHAAVARFGADAPASAALLQAFDAQLLAYEAWLAESGESLHLRSKPSGSWLRTETVITPRQGYVAPHTHACTWVSAVYYVEVPAGLVGKEGCLEFAPPVHKVALQDGLWPVFTLKPRPGLLALFPGYFYHHVYPTQAAGDRVVVTFDLKPTRESRPHVVDPELLAATGFADQE